MKEILKRLRENDPTLTVLDLRGNDIDSTVAAALAEALRGNTTLTKLSLGFNDIGSTGAEAMAEALRENHTLTVGLWNNNISATLTLIQERFKSKKPSKPTSARDGGAGKKTTGVGGGADTDMLSDTEFEATGGGGGADTAEEEKRRQTAEQRYRSAAATEGEFEERRGQARGFGQRARSAITEMLGRSDERTRELDERTRELSERLLGGEEWDEREAEAIVAGERAAEAHQDVARTKGIRTTKPSPSPESGESETRRLDEAGGRGRGGRK